MSTAEHPPPDHASSQGVAPQQGVPVTAGGADLPDGMELRPSGSGAGELVATTAACSLRLDLQGAHLLSFVPAGGEDLLWLSPLAVREPGAAVRGGVPVCAPWFAGGPEGDRKPSHGPARTQRWRLVEARTDPDGTVHLGLATTADGVDLHLAVTGGAQLHLDLTLALPAATGAADGAAAGDAPSAGRGDRHVEAALHTYLAVDAVDSCTLTGLDGATVVDKLSGQVLEQSGELRPDGAIDRIHRLAGPVRLEDGRHSVLVEPQGAADTVVWSPGPEGAAATADLPEDGWDRFLCVESACIGARADGVDHGILLEPGGRHTLSVTYTPSGAGAGSPGEQGAAASAEQGAPAA